MNYTIFKQKSKTKSQSKINLDEICVVIAIFLVMIFILSSPVYYAQSVLSGLRLFLTAVLPGLLPFMFLCKILTSLNLEKITKVFRKPMKALFNLSDINIYPFFMSILSGYPIGSKITTDLYKSGKITDQEALKCSILSSTSGPIFVIGSVGAIMLKNIKVAIIIYASNIISAILSVALLNLIEKIKLKRQKKDIQQKDKQTFTTEKTFHENNILQIMSKASKDTAQSLLVVGFYIAFFSVIIDMLNKTNVIPSICKLISPHFAKTSEKMALSSGIMSGIVEMTRGIKIVSEMCTPLSSLSFSFISFLIAFGGFSILFQSLAFLSETKIKTSKFILYKFIQGIISFFITFLILLI